MYHVSFPGLGIENIEISPVALSVGSFTVNWYGVIIAVGLCLAVAYAMFNCKRYAVSQDKLLDCVLVGIITAIIGARLYYVAFRWDVYSADPISILYINEGGLAIYGGLIGGLLGGLIVAKILKMNIPGLLDLACLGFLIGQGIGRWGNFMNQEAFGTPTDLPWGMVSENTGNIAVHPCFLYESLWCLLGFVLLHFFSKKFQKYDGQIFLMYLVWYGVERTVVEGLRTDSLYTPFLNLRVSQLVSIVIAAVGLTLLIINLIRKKDTMAVPIKNS
ncbi:MAG: prolipoprotein diacylglyceryl transferase [Acutalibacteraceae bacterium]